MKKIKVLSLFDGISGGRLALERTGIPIEVYYASEIDKYAIQVTQKNYPNTIQLGDVTKIDFKQFEGKIDLLMGGSPCQDLSVAKNNRKGLAGERSGLFFKYAEALQTIKPKYFLLENVASMSKENKNKITEILGVEPIMINSALVSAQQRKRLYWTNISNVTQPTDKGILLKDILESGLTEDKKSCTIKAQYQRNSSANFFAKNGRRATSVFEPIRLGHLEGRSNAQANRIYSIEGKTVCLNANGGGGGAKTGLYKIDLSDGDYIVRKLTPIECERLQTLPDNYTEGISNAQRYKTIGNGWTVDVIAHIFKYLKKDLENEH